VSLATQNSRTRSGVERSVAGVAADRGPAMPRRERCTRCSFHKNTLYSCCSIFYFSLIAGRVETIRRNEWRAVSGRHSLVFLEANEPRQSLVDPGVNHGFETDYGFEIFRGISSTKRVFRARTGFKGFKQRKGKFSCPRQRTPLPG
jgi:hypothetical protein